jgi:hypothetical protein
MRYWLVMQADAADMPYRERRAELQMLAQHCGSEVLRATCEKNLDMVGRRPVRQRLSEIRA